MFQTQKTAPLGLAMAKGMRWGLVAVLLAALTPVRAIHAQETGGPAGKDISQAWGGPIAATEQPSAEEVVRAMYQKAQALLQGSGHKATIELSEFRNVSRASFGRMRWTELASREDRILELATHFISAPQLDKRAVHIEAEWRDAAALATATKHAVEALTLRDAAEIVDRPDFNKTFGGTPPGKSIAMTSYLVSLEALGERLEYRAAVIWRQLEDGTYVASTQDTVLAVDTIVWLDEEPTDSLDRKEIWADEFSAAIDLPSKANECIAQDPFVFRPLKEEEGTVGHLSGRHVLAIEMNVDWSCTANCQAECEEDFGIRFCADSGDFAFPVTSHKRFLMFDRAGESAPNQATCMIAAQCAFSECVLGFCGSVTVGVEIEGFTVGFTVSGDPIDPPLRLQDKYTRACVRRPPPCRATATKVHTLSMDGAGALPLAKSSYVLDRVEASGVEHHGKPVRYVMDEWALLAVGSGGAEVLRTSDGRFASAKAGSVLAPSGPVLAKTGQASRTTLVIETPAHPDNDRLIPLPAVRFAAEPLPANLPRGHVMVRFDMADDRTLQDMTIIEDSVGGVTPALREAIHDRFSLDFQSEKQHRVVTYAVLEIGDTISVRDSVVVLPKCCVCVPEPGQVCQ